MLLLLFCLIIVLIVFSTISVVIERMTINSTEFDKKKILYNKFVFTEPPDYVGKWRPTTSESSKNIFRLWCDHKICGGRDITKLSSVFELTRKNLPGWKEEIYTDARCDAFLLHEFEKEHLIYKAYHLINRNYGAARADLLRYLLVYKYGGLYLDIKSAVNSPLPDLSEDASFSRWNNHTDIIKGGEICNWFVYGKKGAPIIKEIINQIVHNILLYHENETYYQNMLKGREPKETVLTITGPIAVSVVIERKKKGYQIDQSLLYKIIYDTGKNDKVVPKNHYSMLREPLLTSHKNIIPKRVYFTTKDIQTIPKHVLENIKKYCHGFDIKIYDDDMCLDFLQKFYGDSAVQIFKSQKYDAWKSDFFRYCILYLFGGYYFDIKTVFLLPIRDIFHDEKKTWFTVLSVVPNTIYNGIIVTPPNNEILWKCIQQFSSSRNKSYLYQTEILLKYIQKACRSKLKVGVNKLKDDWTCKLLEETCLECATEKCPRPPDRYGYNCDIKDENKKLLFFTRYNDYPWSKK